MLHGKVAGTAGRANGAAAACGLKVAEADAERAAATSRPAPPRRPVPPRRVADAEEHSVDVGGGGEDDEAGQMLLVISCGDYESTI